MNCRHLAFDLWNTIAYSLESDPLIELANNILQITLFNLEYLQSLLQTKEFRSSIAFTEICHLLEIPYCHDREVMFKHLIEKERNNFTVFEETIPVLRQAKEIGFTVSIVSNLWDFCIPVIEKKLLSQFKFDYIFYSFKIGSVKPKIKFFQAIQTAGINLSELIVIGGSFHSDILGSINSGAMAIWLRRESENGNNTSLFAKERYEIYSDRYLGLVNNLYEALEIAKKFYY